MLTPCAPSDNIIFTRRRGARIIHEQLVVVKAMLAKTFSCASNIYFDAAREVLQKVCNIDYRPIHDFPLARRRCRGKPPFARGARRRQEAQERKAGSRRRRQAKRKCARYICAQRFDITLFTLTLFIVTMIFSVFSRAARCARAYANIFRFFVFTRHR